MEEIIKGFEPRQKMEYARTKMASFVKHDPFYHNMGLIPLIPAQEAEYRMKDSNERPEEDRKFRKGIQHDNSAVACGIIVKSNEKPRFVKRFITPEINYGLDSKWHEKLFNADKEHLWESGLQINPRDIGDYEIIKIPCKRLGSNRYSFWFFGGEEGSDSEKSKKAQGFGDFLISQGKNEVAVSVLEIKYSNEESVRKWHPEFMIDTGWKLFPLFMNSINHDSNSQYFHTLRSAYSGTSLNLKKDLGWERFYEYKKAYTRKQINLVLQDLNLSGLESSIIGELWKLPIQYSIQTLREPEGTNEEK